MTGLPSPATLDGTLAGPSFAPMTGPERPHRILALPHAGAGCTAFAGCAAALPSDVGLWALNLPGRQARFGEASITDIEELVALVAADLPSDPRLPYVLLGYCSGALLAFLIARAAAASGLPGPRALIVASYPAPHLARPDQELHTLPPGEFWDRIRSHGGFPSALAEQSDYREIFEPALRADYAALAGFTYQDGPPLTMPIVAVAGKRDRSAPESHFRAWAEQTVAGFRLEVVDGDHWLLDGAGGELMSIAERECR